MNAESLNVYEYSDYRQFLKDFYTREKTKNPSYSFRVFAIRAKLGSPNYLKLVIDGERRITDKNLPQFIRGLRLSRQEAEFFRNLVLFQESEDTEAKNQHFETMLKLRARAKNEVNPLPPEQAEKLRHWAAWAIREMTELKDFVEDPDWISQRLGRRVSPAVVRETWDLLKSSGSLRFENGKWARTELVSSVGEEGRPSTPLRELHRQFAELSMVSLDRDPAPEREFSGIMIALPRSRLLEIKQLIRDFRRDLNRIYSQMPDPDDVYYIAFNLFPVTTRGGVNQ